jgi:SulP family sulfate permease
MTSLPPIVIVRLRNMTAIDSTGIQALERMASEIRDSGRTLLLCGAREQPAQLIHQPGFEKRIGQENICEHITDAITRAQSIFEATDHPASV